MRKIAIALIIVSLAASIYAASPAATQQWVRNYVATNTPSGGGVSESWVRDFVASYVITNTVSSTSSASVLGRSLASSKLAINMIESVNSGLYALTFGKSETNGTSTVVRMVEPQSGGGWTNAVYGCSVATNTTNEAVLIMDALSYNCSTFSNYTAINYFTRISGGTTNTLMVYQTSVTTNDYNTARGAN